LSRVISVAGSLTVSTTVQILKSSTSPTSGLYFASRRNSCPTTLRAADCMAFSTAAMTIALSIPRSLLTCSMTRVSSGCIVPPHSAPSLGAFGNEVVFVVGVRHGREGNEVLAAVGGDHDAIDLDPVQGPEERSAAGDRARGAHPH